MTTIYAILQGSCVGSHVSPRSAVFLCSELIIIPQLSITLNHFIGILFKCCANWYLPVVSACTWLLTLISNYSVLPVVRSSFTVVPIYLLVWSSMLLMVNATCYGVCRQAGCGCGVLMGNSLAVLPKLQFTFNPQIMST